MDLKSEQHRFLSKMLEDWSKNEALELEATFGERGVVDSSTFLHIAQRIRSKGFEVIPQDDRLNILTPNQIRVSLQGLGIIQAYCKDDSLQQRAFTVMRKERNSPDSTIDIADYDVRVKMRMETELSSKDEEVRELLESWPKQKKAFRLIRRWSFKKQGIRIDMSMIRQTPIDPQTRQFQWSTSFLQKNILLEPARHEVEVELLHGTEYTRDAEMALKTLIRGIGEILRAMQRNSLLIRKSVASSVRSAYYQMVGTKEFRGVNPVTLQMENMTENINESIPNIRTGFNVTDKADGLRAMGYVDSTGELFLLDQSMNVYRTGLRNKACALSLVDGEWVTMTIDKQAVNHYLIFDIYHYDGGKKVSHLPFATFKGSILDNETPCRYLYIKAWYDQWMKGTETISKGVSEFTRLVVSVKRFEFAAPGDDSIFKSACSSILDGSQLYHTDGLILTSLSLGLPDGAGVRFSSQFKWKPAIDNTIDFLIKYAQDSEQPRDVISTTIAPSGEILQYKTMNLYVGAASQSHPRDVILNELPLVKKTSQYQPILFTPMEYSDTMANICYIPVHEDAETLESYCMTVDTNEPIPDCSIVEMRYEPSREPGWRWVPSRIRHDKTERLNMAKELSKKTGKTMNYTRMMNDVKVANSVWNSIHDPITVSMIRSGRMEPSKEEMQALLHYRIRETDTTYYQRSAPKENTALVKGLRDFHNQYIKRNILLRSTMKGRTHLVDVACGKGGDLWKWMESGASYVMGIDYAGENITNPKDGAYARYVDILSRAHGRAPKIAFAIGNSSERIVTGDAGVNQQEKDILRSVFGRQNPDGPVPKYIDHIMAGQFRDGADVTACMFALHYFFENSTMLDGFLGNLADIVKTKGYFVGCCFDGDSVFNLLKNLDKGQSKDGMEGDIPIWSITKEYDEIEFADDDTSLGLAVDVEFISIGAKHREYLVSFPYLVKRMKAIGFRLLNKEEQEAIQLENSEALFKTSYKMALKQREKFPMLDSIKDFSFLNRWFIFIRDSIEHEEVPPIVLEQTSEYDEKEQQPAAAAAAEETGVVDEEEEKTSGWRGPHPTKTFSSSEVIPFGITVPYRPITGMADSQGATQYISLSAIVPNNGIPDPLPKELGGEEVDESEIVYYPTIEHYLAGMKLKHAVRYQSPSLLYTVMSTGGKLHQTALKEITKYTINTDKYYKALAAETKKIHEYMSKKAELQAIGATVEEEKWSTMQDTVLRNALQYRFRYDERFRKIVLDIKGKNKYLLHSKPASRNNSAINASVSERYGERNSSTGRIEGANRVGMLIMEIADFNFPSV
jgi:predicted NAD-dependent protein-ADP-ribosyltransferase YbiA (DUF1768 family)